MTDIDFDELDKAVNSALAPREVAQADAPAAAEPVASTPAAPASMQPAEAKKTEESPRIILTPRPRQPIDSPAAKRSGRFMDMVHPSSDMANEKKEVPASKVKIMPLGDSPKTDKADEPEKEATPEKVEAQEAPEVAPKPDLDIPSVKPEVDEAKAESKEDEPEFEMKSEYPDPIDVAGPLSIAEELPKADETTAPASTEPTPPAEAPFLPDAKVEKRPLGGFSPDESAPEDTEAHDDEESQLPPETSLPAALQSDVVAVESDVLPDPVPKLEDEDDDDEAETKSIESEEKPVSKSPEHSAAAPKHDQGPAQSIPQQYHAEPVKADEDPRPVFDTDQYHQPLIPAHAGKKSHVWVFILLVAALLAVGGTLGYFAFMSGL